MLNAFPSITNSQGQQSVLVEASSVRYPTLGAFNNVFSCRVQEPGAGRLRIWWEPSSQLGDGHHPAVSSWGGETERELQRPHLWPPSLRSWGFSIWIWRGYKHSLRSWLPTVSFDSAQWIFLASAAIPLFFLFSLWLSLWTHNLIYLLCDQLQSLLQLQLQSLQLQLISYSRYSWCSKCRIVGHGGPTCRLSDVTPLIFASLLSGATGAPGIHSYISCLPFGLLFL